MPCNHEYAPFLAAVEGALLAGDAAVVVGAAAVRAFALCLSTRWRRRMRGEADYFYLTNHVVILG